MKNKVLIKVFVPMLEKEYDVFIPVNEMVWKVNVLIAKSINDLNDGVLNDEKEYFIINVENGKIYNGNEIIINTDIRNYTRVALLEL